MPQSVNQKEAPIQNCYNCDCDDVNCQRDDSGNGRIVFDSRRKIIIERNPENIEECFCRQNKPIKTKI